MLVFFVVLAERLGLEAILGAFLAGAILKLLDRDEMLTHPEFRQKLEAVGYGVFVPVFFVATGVQFDLSALFANATSLARVPIFLTAGQIGVDLDLVRPVVYAALVAAGLLSVVLFPATALALLRSAKRHPRGVLGAPR